MKKLISCVLTAILTMTVCFSLIGCNDARESKESKVMNVSCNPAVQFVLNEDDVVISVNATNEEGNLILQAKVNNDTSDFEGKTASDAAKLFVEVSNELGFIVSGDATAKGGSVEISFSGDAKKAEKLFEDVKKSVESYLSKENLTVAINKTEAIAKEHLEKLVAEVSPYLDQAEIKAMEYGKLIEELHNSNKETAKLYSQELKKAYYQAKADIMEAAELETLKGHLSGLAETAVSVTMELYNAAVKVLENTRKTLFVDEASVYQVALKAFREAKVNYLNYRKKALENAKLAELANEVKTELDRLDKLVQDAETAIVNAGKTANDAIDKLKADVSKHKDNIIKAIQDASVKVNDHVTEISSNQKTAIANFTTQFEKDYGTAISSAKSSWASMKEQLTTAKA